MTLRLTIPEDFFAGHQPRAQDIQCKQGLKECHLPPDSMATDKRANVIREQVKAA